MYVAAAVLPFASGTGSAVKGVAMDLVGEDEKADALSGIALIEKLGTSFSLPNVLCLGQLGAIIVRCLRGRKG